MKFHHYTQSANWSGMRIFCLGSDFLYGPNELPLRPTAAGPTNGWSSTPSSDTCRSSTLSGLSCPFFGQKKSARPDFLVLGRDLGLIIIEVKDWSIDRIHRANRDTFHLFIDSQEFQQLLDQERKLLYVGMTRARRCALHHLQRRRPRMDFQPAAGQAAAVPAHGVRTAFCYSTTACGASRGPGLFAAFRPRSAGRGPLDA
jgi:hypothetical protein